MSLVMDAPVATRTQQSFPIAMQKHLSVELLIEQMGFINKKAIAKKLEELLGWQSGRQVILDGVTLMLLPCDRISIFSAPALGLFEEKLKPAGFYEVCCYLATQPDHAREILATEGILVFHGNELFLLTMTTDVADTLTITHVDREVWDFNCMLSLGEDRNYFYAGVYLT